MLRLTPRGPIVIFGGSFDPPTRAHASLPPLAAEQLGASRLIYVPAATSPHKLGSPPADGEHRLAMLRLALADCPEAEVDTRELDRTGPSFTVETLESFRREVHPSTTFRLLIGSDQAAVFHTWHRWNDILRLAEPAVLIREGDDPETVLSRIASSQGSKAAASWRPRLLPLPTMPQASTVVREAAAAQRSLDGVPPAVSRYIQANGLYGSEGAPPHAD